MRNCEERLPMEDSSLRRFKVLPNHILVDSYQILKTYLKTRKEKREKYYSPREENKEQEVQSYV